MARYRKKPVVIDAMRVYGDVDRLEELAEWCNGDVGHGPSGPGVLIRTLEGTMRADVGDWIIRGVKGEFYPCKPDIFESTYEAVDG